MEIGIYFADYLVGSNAACPPGNDSGISLTGQYSLPFFIYA